MARKLMYSGFGNEQMVYLVWDNRKTWASRPDPVFVEKVVTDHLYGSHDMTTASALIRRGGE